MSLATVRAYVWRKPEDLVLNYRVTQTRWSETSHWKGDHNFWNWTALLSVARILCHTNLTCFHMDMLFLLKLGLFCYQVRSLLLGCVIPSGKILLQCAFQLPPSWSFVCMYIFGFSLQWSLFFYGCDLVCMEAPGFYPTWWSGIQRVLVFVKWAGKGMEKSFI